MILFSKYENQWPNNCKEEFKFIHRNLLMTKCALLTEIINEFLCFNYNLDYNSKLIVKNCQDYGNINCCYLNFDELNEMKKLYLKKIPKEVIILSIRYFIPFLFILY